MLGRNREEIQMKRWMAMALAAVLLSGCVAAPDTTGVHLEMKPTVEDLFTAPAVTTAPTVAAAPTASEATEATQPGVAIPYGGMGFGPNGDKQLDEFGSYFVYEGGEMCMPFMLQADGQAMIDSVEYGIGIQLMVDGQPQPYRVGEDGELGYFHIIYPDFNTDAYLLTQTVNIDLYFTPVSGKAGETVEFYACTILRPKWQLSDPYTGFKYTFGGVQSGSRLKMNATPPKAEKPQIPERIHSLDISYVDATYAEIGGWSDRDLIEKYEYDFKMNGQPLPGNRSSYIYEVTADEPVELRFEVWGTPYVKYGLMFYVDNQPISSREVIHFDMKSGQKTVVTVMMDLSDFDGETVIYAALIPLNARSTDILTYAFLDMSKTYYLLDDPMPET